MLGFFASFILATLISPILIKIYRKYGWIDDPKKQNHIKTTHQKAVPRGGGIVIFLAKVGATQWERIKEAGY